MADEMYPEAEVAETEEVRDDGVETTLVPKSMFPKAQVGETIKVKVVAALEDELEVEATKADEADHEMKPKGDDMESRMTAAMGDE